MKKVMTLTLTVATIFTILFLTGCSNSNSYSGSSYYRNYHDPYPNWGRRSVYIRHDDHDRTRPPTVRPPESRPPRPPNVGRPPNRPSRPVHRPAQRPAARRR